MAQIRLQTEDRTIFDFTRLGRSTVSTCGIGEGRDRGELIASVHIFTTVSIGGGGGQDRVVSWCLSTTLSSAFMAESRLKLTRARSPYIVDLNSSDHIKRIRLSVGPGRVSWCVASSRSRNPFSCKYLANLARSFGCERGDTEGAEEQRKKEWMKMREEGRWKEEEWGHESRNRERGTW
jgi:hypothetical protein